MAGRGTLPSLTLAQQYAFLRASPLVHGTGQLKPTGLVWEYAHRPTLLSREYLLRIEYRRGGVPRVIVKEPDIAALAGGRDIPHVYKNPLRLCLYVPGSGEWDGTMRIDETFVPWTLGLALLLRGVARLRRVEGRRGTPQRPAPVASEPPRAPRV